MVKTCSVFRCPNKADKRARDNNISFYRFPANRRKRRAWVKAIKRKNWQPNVHCYVCSAHFAHGWHSDDPQDENYAPTIFNRMQTSGHSFNTRIKINSKENILTNVLHTTGHKLSDSGKSTKLQLPVEHLKPEIDRQMYLQFSVWAHNYCKTDVHTATGMDLVHNKTEEFYYLGDDRQDATYRSQWSIEQLQDDDHMTRLITGLPSFSVFMWLFQYLNHNLGGQPHTQTDISGNSLEPINQFLSVLMRLKLGLPEEAIAERFSITPRRFSEYFSTWIILLHDKLSALNVFPGRDIIDKTRPSCFRQYPDLRIVLNSFEICLPLPAVEQNQTSLGYLDTITLKFLIGSTPAGVIFFVSEALAGETSNRTLALQSGVLDLLESGDGVLARDSFPINDLLHDRNCFLISPHMDSAKPISGEMDNSLEVTEELDHVDRSMDRVKQFGILSGILPSSLEPVTTQVFRVCCWLANFSVPDVK